MLSKMAMRQPLRKALKCTQRLATSKMHTMARPKVSRCTPASNQLQIARFSSAQKAEDPEVFEAEEVKPQKVTKQNLDDIEIEEEEADEDSYVDISNETSGATKKHTFQAETKRILDIVANSLYTDKEVFLREIISNASDALEKARFLEQADQELVECEKDLQINIYVNEKNNTLIIQDFGIGMTKEELVSNLGTIARSGTKQFVEAAESGDASNMIGQFGVGFYSCFMVSDKVEVYSLSAKKEGDAQAHYWCSDGTGEYDLAEADGVQRGTKIIIHLKDDASKYSIKHIIEGVVRKYSNFVGFPIYLNDAKLNTVAAVWSQDKNAVSEETHLEFYRYIANAYDSPFFRMQFQTDAPIDIKSLFYFPERHMEKYGMGRAEPGVSLYCRKVLIQHKCAAILPEWLRFCKGVVDSEDIPLNISRENMQDSALITRMSNVLTKRIIKFLAEMSKKEPEKYEKFWNEFGNFIKEGVCSDFNHKGEIAQLLRFDTSLGETNSCSLDDYVARMPVEQDKIFYLCAPNRQSAINSPYFESFDKDGVEVIFMYNNIDEFVMKNLEKYNKRTLVSIESADASPKSGPKKEEDKKEDAELQSESADLVKFFEDALKDKVLSVKATDRLSNSPAIVVDHQSAAVRKMMSYVDASGAQELPKQKLQVNPKHPTMVKLLAMRTSDPELAQLVAEQVYDNALISADILDNPRTMLSRLNKILEKTCSV